MVPEAPIRILVVDDEPKVRELIQRLLERDGYVCEGVGDAQAALERLRDGVPVALVVSDINMPGMSGLDLLAAVRERHEEVAVLMVTGVDDRRVGVHALELGAYGYVTKPFDRNELAINVANALERRRLTLLARAAHDRLEGEVRRRTEQIRRREEEIAHRLVAAAGFRHSETGDHVRRIGLYSAALGRLLGWPEARVDDLRVAAMMHDIGKIGVPDSILLKPGPLLPQEFEVIKGHTLIGARILDRSDVPMLHMAREIALSHHERWDGSGYPHGLAGDAIPESARIVAVVDVYDALVHDRVYRAALPEDRVLEMIVEQMGRHFDRQAAEAFLSASSRFRDIREQVLATTPE